MASAKAANALLHLSPSDQQACLAVIEEFFTSPDELPSDDSDLMTLILKWNLMLLSMSLVHLNIHVSILFTIGMRMEHNRVNSVMHV